MHRGHSSLIISLRRPTRPTTDRSFRGPLWSCQSGWVTFPTLQQLLKLKISTSTSPLQFVQVQWSLYFLSEASLWRRWCGSIIDSKDRRRFLRRGSDRPPGTYHRNFFLQFVHIPLFLGLLFVAMLWNGGGFIFITSDLQENVGQVWSWIMNGVSKPRVWEQGFRSFQDSHHSEEPLG